MPDQRFPASARFRPIFWVCPLQIIRKGNGQKTAAFYTVPVDEIADRSNQGISAATL